MKIKRIVGGSYESNGYVIFQKTGKECFIIDPGYQYKSFLKLMEEEGLVLEAILLTHHHSDHVGAVENLVKATGCKAYISIWDQHMYKGDTIPIENGHTFDLGGEEIKTIHTPGHTEGSVCFLSETSNLAFTGDTIFNIDLGRTDLEDGNQAKMEESIRNIISKWPQDLVIYPGHGDHCNMKYVRKNNSEYIEIMEK